MYKLLLPLVLLANISIAQDTLPLTINTSTENPPATFSHTEIQATFLLADSAVISPVGDLVQIQVEGLKERSTQGVVLSIEGIQDPQIEVTTLIELEGYTVGLWPPALIEPNTNGTYNILGDPGQQFGIRADTFSGIERFQIQIDGTPEPPPSKGPTDQDLANISNISSAHPSEPITTQHIREALIATSLSEVLDVAIGQVHDAIGEALLESMKLIDPPYKDWEGKFRKPLDAAIVEISTQGRLNTTTDLQKIVDAIVAGLSSNGQVTIYTHPTCTICNNWLRDVAPKLRGSGWSIVQIQSEGELPRFTIRNNNKETKLVGYMDVTLFNKTIRKTK